MSTGPTLIEERVQPWLGQRLPPGDHEPLRVIIVGGGIAGLATAYYLQREAAGAGRAVTIRLFEREPRVGGKVVTVREGGFVIEGGPDSFLTTKPWAVRLCHELGLADRLIPTNPDVRRVFVLAGGRLRPLPDGLRLIAPTRLWPFLRSDLISTAGKLRMGLDLVIPPRRDGGDESVGAFVRRRLGREAVDRLAEPLLAGIYVADPDRLSLAATFPQLMALEQNHGSLLRGMWATERQSSHRPRRPAGGAPTGSTFVSLIGGTAELIEALSRALGPILRTGREVAVVERADRAFVVRLDDTSEHRCDALVVATPAPVAAGLLAVSAPEVARGVAAIRHVSAATVSLAFTRAEMDHPLDGYGFVVARGEPIRILACTWASTKLAGRAPEGAALVRAFVGGPGREGDVELPDAALVDLVRADLRQVMGITAAPTLARVFRWPAGNPQYDVGHLDRVSALEAACPRGLYLVGSAYRGVGLPDCIRSARLTARRLLAEAAPPGAQRDQHSS